jgi:hypothetical protein
MHEFVLHIGRHKTGTSSLQKFLDMNRAALRERGFDYADEGRGRKIAHHELADVFARRVRAKFKELSAEEKTKVSAVVDAVRATPVVLLSSEAFQNAEPQIVAQYFLRGRTKVVCYLREQAEYVISAYQQKVHATNHWLSLEESVQPLVVNYDAFLHSWENAFGRDALQVRCYDRHLLKDGDIVADFADLLGIHDLSGFSIDRRDQNPSIGGALLELKRVLNAFNDGAIDQRRMYKVMSSLAVSNEAWRRRPQLPAHRVEEIRESMRQSNQRMFARYFDGSDVFRSRPAEMQSLPTCADPVEIRQLLQQARALDEQLYSQIRTRLLSDRGALVDFEQRNGPGASLREMAECVVKVLREDRE